MIRWALICGVGLSALCGADVAGARDAPAATAGELAELKAALADLRARQQELDGQLAHVADRIAAIQGEASVPEAMPHRARPDNVAAAPSAPVRMVAAPSSASALDVSGDLRLRYESNFGGEARGRDRSSVRARLRAEYRLSPKVRVGAQLVTGDPDDPNSVDVTLSSFADDFQVSLDRVYAAAQLGDVTIVGGKFALPFARTDMVWDGDVSPQGAAISWRRKADADGAFGAHALFFPIDEDVGGADSRMLGGQVFARQSFGEAIRLDASLGYYDYRLRALASADAGDIRGNRFGGGRYLSDFDLVDAIVGLTYAPASRWPVTLRGNYVVNRGAPADLDTGYAVQLVAGTQAAPGDIRVSYGYSRVEQDAVFAAFSHDNTVISTGYVQHDLGLDYRLPHGLALNLSYYRFRPIDAAGPNPWLNRLRLAALFSF